MSLELRWRSHDGLRRRELALLSGNRKYLAVVERIEAHVRSVSSNEGLYPLQISCEGAQRRLNRSGRDRADSPPTTTTAWEAVAIATTSTW